MSHVYGEHTLLLNLWKFLNNVDIKAVSAMVLNFEVKRVILADMRVKCSRNGEVLKASSHHFSGVNFLKALALSHY